MEYLLLSVPSFVAGGFALAWWLARTANGRLSVELDRAVRSAAGLRVGLQEASRDPVAFAARIERVEAGRQRPPRDERVAAIRERRTAERAARLNG